MLHNRFPLIRLRIIGAGDYLNDVKALSRKLGVESAVSFENPVPIQHLAEKIGEAQVGLVPNHASSATHLMLPVKLLEYVACGIPVICARLRTVEHYFNEQSVRFFSRTIRHNWHMRSRTCTSIQRSAIVSRPRPRKWCRPSVGPSRASAFARPSIRCSTFSEGVTQCKAQNH